MVPALKRLFSGNISGLPAVLALLLLLLSLCFQVSYAEPGSGAENRILASKIRSNISLYDLIGSSGFSINDADVVSFLTDFMKLNPDIKSISLLKKGAIVRIPVRHLIRSGPDRPVFTEKRGLGAVKQRILGRHEGPVVADKEKIQADRSILLRNIQRLFTGLGEDITVETAGFKYFQVGENSEFSFDASNFPVVDLHSDHILVIDSAGSFPEDLKDLLEVSWPEYRVVRRQRGTGLRAMVPVLLRESGYLFQEESKMVSGGQSKVEYYSDFLVHGRSGKAMEGDISLISVLDNSEYATPQGLVSWFGKRDVRIIELSEQDRKYINRKPGQVIMLERDLPGREFAESVLSIFGYPFSRDERIEISSANIQYRLKADLVIDLGYRKKAISFSGVSDSEARFAAKRSLDIARIEPWEGRRESLRKIMSLLSLNCGTAPRENAAVLTPRKARYRLLLPGYTLRALKGTFFMTDADLDDDLLKSIAGEGISVVRF